MGTGREFELEIKAALESELQSGGLGLLPGYARVFHRKAYKSSARGEIITDVSVEAYHRTTTSPWLIWVWECKDYRGPVPVSDVEEFSSKLHQIGFHNTKGTVACRNGFQNGAMEFAKNRGISLVRLLPDGSILRLLEAPAEATPEALQQGLTELSTERLSSMYYGLSTFGNSTSAFSDLVALELADYVRAEARSRKEAGLPKFDVGTGNLSRVETGIKPDWRIRQTSGEDVGKLEWRFRCPRHSTEWRQADISALSRTHIIADISLTEPIVADDKVGQNELGLEIRCYWRGGWRHELHRWELGRSGDKQMWDVGREVLPPIRWDGQGSEVDPV